MRTFVAPSGAEKGSAPRAAHGRGKRALCLVLCAAAVFAAAGIAGCAPARARSRYAMTLEYFPETRTLAGEMTADVVNTSQTAWEEIAFRLRANAWREEPPVSALYAPAVFYGEERKGAIEVLSVSGGEPSLSEDGTLLHVALPEPLYPEERAAVGMRFTLTLPEANFRFGAGESVVALTDFYPVLSACAQEEASPYADAAVNGFADYDVTLTLPETYLVACTGGAERTSSGGEAVCRVRAENVRDVAFFLSEDFGVTEGEACGVPVVYYYLDDPSPEDTLAAAEDALACYGEMFGEYRFSAFTLAEADLPAGDAAYPMLCVLGRDTRQADRARAVAEGTAHQWWYAAVGSDRFCSPWQDESLCAYAAARFLGERPAYEQPYAESVAASERAYRAFFSVQSQLGGAGVMSLPLNAFAGEYELRSLTREKGVILFDRLFSMMGEKKALAALREYYKKYAGSIAPPEALIACFAARSPYAEGMFSSFLDGTCVI